MAQNPFTMMPLGTQAPDFILEDVISNKPLSLSNIHLETGLVVMFLSAHCPYVQHLEEEIAFVSEKYERKGIGFVGISSNDIINCPDDAPEKLKEQAENNDFEFPYLFDETQEVAKGYIAACTPDFYLFDNELKCVYHGRFDGSSPDNDEPVTGEDLREAMDQLLDGQSQLLDGQSIYKDQKPSVGCGIKWK